MISKKTANHCCVAVAILALILMWAAAGDAQTLKVIHNFGGTGDGNNPESPLLIDGHGNLYGADWAGPTAGGFCQPDFGCGVVFQLTPNVDGSWTENILYNFNLTGFDGNPEGPLAFDSHGNLYGTANVGGEAAGTVFELTNSNGTWNQTILHNFTGGSDGGGPIGLAYNHGQLYGATQDGGTYHSGVVFDLMSVSVRGWYELVAHAFGQNNGDSPNGWLMLDSQRSIYGNTLTGGRNGLGSIFRLAPNPLTFGWTYTDLYDFADGVGGRPVSPNGFLTFDASGNLYGTTYGGGMNSCTAGCGTVFKLTPNPNGSWSESVIYAFSGPPDGDHAVGGVTFDAAGNLYGATGSGGTNDDGMLFRLTFSQGQWRETWTYSFDFSDGAGPIGGLISDGAGNLYGVTGGGGPNGGFGDLGGVAFEITP